MMNDIFLMLGLIFVLFNFIKTFYYLRYSAQFDVIKGYFRIPEIILLIPYTITVVNTFLSLDSSLQKTILTILFIASLGLGWIGFHQNQKIAIVLSAIGYMYIFGICLTKNINFMMP